MVSSFFLLGNHWVKAQTKEEPSLFSSSVVFSQNDYQKEDFLALKDVYFKQGAKEGVMEAVSSIDIESEVSETKEGALKPEIRREVIKYKVKQGDVISTIANRYGLKSQTLLWANKLGERSIIQPGDVIKIPPTDGVLYKVKRGDTLGGIAQKHSSDTKKILEFNQIKSDKIFEGQELFLPGGKMPSPAPATSTRTSAPSYSKPTITYRSYSKGCHRFPYGYCTWYVAQKRCVPWGGDARTWLYNSRAYGYSTGSQPVPGAIMVTRESWWGHVAYVERVSGNYVTISEMNKYGWGRVNYRTLHKNSGVIRGYIY